MLSPAPSSLDPNALALRLAELAGDEREVQVEFLLHLAEFDPRRAYVEAGFPSLWAYCLEVLHLREGAAGRRIGAMRVLVRFPRLEAALRDGRLALSTIIVLGPVLTEENLDSLLARAAYRTKREVEELVVSLQPRPAPAPGLRKLPGARRRGDRPARSRRACCSAVRHRARRASVGKRRRSTRSPPRRALHPSSAAAPPSSSRSRRTAGRSARPSIARSRRTSRPFGGCSVTRSRTVTSRRSCTRRSAAPSRSTGSAGAPSRRRGRRTAPRRRCGRPARPRPR